MHIFLLIPALNDLYIHSEDIENFQLKYPCKEKIWTRAGHKFGQDKGKVFITVMEFYGLKSSGAAFREFFAEQLDNIGFKSSIADPDVWIRPTTKAYGENYYEFILVYVDNLLAIIQYAVSVIREVVEKFKLKKTRSIRLRFNSEDDWQGRN